MDRRSIIFLRNLRERLQIALHNGVDERPRLLLRIPRRHVHHVRLHHHRAASASAGGGDGGDGSVVPEAVIASDDAEPDDVALVVEDLEPLGAGPGREAGHHGHLPEGAHRAAVPDDDVAALEEFLVLVWPVEAAHHGPDGLEGRVDGLHRRGAALLGGHRVGMVAEQVRWEGGPRGRGGADLGRRGRLRRPRQPLG
ncbi:hypothetical protein SASPL_146061 [Salvia splendens]|uniref:Uncharacterized protein n=1 Tax=Salvia splendens TaxID=180675 RepID=A0A8X8WK72_SALSN|nr:hypothetical protein SASPL_146061 [Salvia splendens]